MRGTSANAIRGHTGGPQPFPCCQQGLGQLQLRDSVMAFKGNSYLGVFEDISDFADPR
jgi:hypothetical protein